jgi:hypothetical protein
LTLFDHQAISSSNQWLLECIRWISLGQQLAEGKQASEERDDFPSQFLVCERLVGEPMLLTNN